MYYGVYGVKKRLSEKGLFLQIFQLKERRVIIPLASHVSYIFYIFQKSLVIKSH